MTHFDAIAGSELDALVAERIMGWKLDPTRTASDGSPFVLSELSRFSESPSSARGVMLILEQRHPGISTRMESGSPYRFVVRGPSGREYTSTDESEAVARCRAMLKAMDGEGPGIPNDKLKAQRGPRVAATVAEILGAATQPHQSVGLSAHAIVLQQGEHKEGAALALLECVATLSHIVPYLEEQAVSGRPDIAEICVVALDYLAQAGAAARVALPAATKHPDSEVAKSALEALQKLGEGNQRDDH